MTRRFDVNVLIIFTIIVILAIVFLGVLFGAYESFLGVPSQADVVKFNAQNNSFVMKFENNPDSEHLDEFGKLVFIIDRLDTNELVWTVWVQDIYDYSTGICRVNGKATTPSRCCGYNGFVANVGDRKYGSGEWRQSCFVNQNVLPDLTMVDVVGEQVTYSMTDTGWITDDVKDDVNDYCDNNYVIENNRQVCYIGVVLVNRVADSSRVSVSVDYFFVEKTLPELVLVENFSLPDSSRPMISIDVNESVDEDIPPINSVIVINEDDIPIVVEKRVGFFEMVWNWIKNLFR